MESAVQITKREVAAEMFGKGLVEDYGPEYCEKMIAAMQAEIKRLKGESEEQAQAEWQAIKTEYDYTVEWVNELMFDCRRTMRQSTKDARAAWRAKYPGIQPKWYSGDENRVEGAKYLLISGWLKINGGGTLILKEKRKKSSDFDCFTDMPLKLTAKEVASLKAGVVPDSIKA